MCKSHPGSTGFEHIKGSRNTVEAWQCKRSWKDMGEGAASVVVDDPGLKKLRLGTMERAYERTLAKASCSRRP